MEVGGKPWTEEGDEDEERLGLPAKKQRSAFFAKNEIMEGIVVPSLLYGTELWLSKAREGKIVEVFEALRTVTLIRNSNMKWRCEKRKEVLRLMNQRILKWLNIRRGWIMERLEKKKYLKLGRWGQKGEEVT